MPVLIGVIGLVIGLVAGYGLGRVSTGTPVNPTKAPGSESPTPGQTVDAGPSLPELKETPVLSGTAVGVSGNRLTFDVDTRVFTLTGGTKLETRRTAILTADTQIVRLVQKTPEEVAADNEAFQKISANAPEDAPPPTPPQAFKRLTISASDIKAGDEVTVEAADDILQVKEFEVLSVTVLTHVEPTPVAVPEPVILPEAEPEPTP